MNGRIKKERNYDEHVIFKGRVIATAVILPHAIRRKVLCISYLFRSHMTVVQRPRWLK